MKTFFTYCLTLGICAVALEAIAQTNKVDQQLFQLEWQKAEKSMHKQLQAGDSTSLLKYADVLLVNGKAAEAYQHYQLAKAAKADFSAKQERNFTHAAMQIGKPSPFYQRSGYFDSLEFVKARVHTFAGNSTFEDFGAVRWQNAIFFASARKSTANRDKFGYALTRQPYLDVVAMDSVGNVEKPAFLPAELNTEWHDGPLSLSTDTNWLFITRNYATPAADGKQQLYIAAYQRSNGIWSKPMVLPFCSADFSVQHPFFHEKEQVLYFSSNRPGGQGGFDLYKSRLEGGNWSPPQNLGNNINSNFDEVFPSLNQDGQLYFASNHPETQGGLDIVCIHNGQRKLLPFPINTVFDDYAAFFTAPNLMLFSSNRESAAFNDDIYWAQLEKVIPPKPVVYELLASFLDAKTEEPLKKAWIDLIADNGDSSRFTFPGGSGSLGKFKHQPPKFLRVRMSAPGYDTLELSGLEYVTTDTILRATVRIQPIELPLAVTGYLAIYFPNAQPRAIPPQEMATIDYGRFYTQYIQEKPNFLKLSASKPNEIEGFFVDVAKGMDDLKLFPARLDTVLRTGRKLKVYMASYTSALGSAESNRGISERRGLVLKNYIVNWNNGELRKYIESGQLIVSADFFPAFSAPTTAKSTKSTSKAVTVYGVDASRMRRVNVVWETID